MFGDQAVAGFVADRINVNYLIRDPANPSGVALIFVGGAGENSIAVAPGSNGKLSPADVRKSQRAFDDACVLVLQLGIPLKTIVAAVDLAAKNGLRVILNPAPAGVCRPACSGRFGCLRPMKARRNCLPA